GDGCPDGVSCLAGDCPEITQNVPIGCSEDNLTIDIDSGKKYFLLVDGYNNAGASGYARVGYSTIYTSTGEAMKYTQNNTTWTIWTRPLCIYVEGSLCKLASITGLDPWYCASNTSITLTTSPAGGTLSGPGISGLIFNSSLAGVGTHHIIYSYTDGNCSEVDTQQVIVYASPAADFTYTVNGAVVDFTDNSSLAANWVWDFSDGYISTLKNVTHFFLYGGIYDVELIVKEDSLICEDNVTKQIDMTHLGASEIDPTGPKLSVFPNPGSALLHLVYTPVGSSDAEILVYDALGVLQINLIMEPTHSATLIHELDISFLASGVYFLQLQIGDETRRVKFVKD
ncbi:MAG: T9SS type A sorting domain-containing protein, partial [Bacteroidetes bacterium]|nr:T9SS type A sorting domain-containing protein [Bacteroidota bacterium]